MKPRRTVFRAAMIADGDAAWHSPGAVLLDQNRIVACGSPQEIGEPADAQIIDLPAAAIIPGLVNVHAHLDLTHIGPQPFTGAFPSWVNLVRSRRAYDDPGIARSVHQGIDLSRAGGTALIGDIAGISSRAPIHALRERHMPGVSFFEVFGNGARQPQAIQAINDVCSDVPAWSNAVALGLQPHAPYSCGLDVYRAAAETALPLATHLAETLEELEFIRTGEGPIKTMIMQIGAWDPTMTGVGVHPIDHLAPVLCGRGALAAHVNYADDEHLAELKRAGVIVAYCPRASAYFGHPFHEPASHRYRDMIDAGIPIALGTDSMICLDTPDRLSVLDEVRLLFRRDAFDPQTLLRMATIDGALALGFDPALVTLAPGVTAGLLAVDIDPRSSELPLHQVLRNDHPPRWIAGPFVPDDDWRVERAR